MCGCVRCSRPCGTDQGNGRGPGWSAPENYYAGEDQQDRGRVPAVQRLVDEEPADGERDDRREETSGIGPRTGAAGLEPRPSGERAAHVALYFAAQRAIGSTGATWLVPAPAR